MRAEGRVRSQKRINTAVRFLFCSRSSCPCIRENEIVLK